MVHVRMVFATPLFIMWIFPPGNSLGCSFCWTDAPDAWQNHCHSHMLHACHIYVIFTYIWVTVKIDSKCYGNIPPGAVLTYRNLNPESMNKFHVQEEDFPRCRLSTGKSYLFGVCQVAGGKRLWLAKRQFGVNKHVKDKYRQHVWSF